MARRQGEGERQPEPRLAASSRDQGASPAAPRPGEGKSSERQWQPVLSRPLPAGRSLRLSGLDRARPRPSRHDRGDRQRRRGRGFAGSSGLAGRRHWTIALAGFHAENDQPPCPAARGSRARFSSMACGRACRPCLALAGTRTYTGQDVAEIHTSAQCPCWTSCSPCLRRGARHAQPGEFTLRAFLCGRIDLTRAEAVLGVIDAHNPRSSTRPAATGRRAFRPLAGPPRSAARPCGPSRGEPRLRRRGRRRSAGPGRAGRRSWTPGPPISRPWHGRLAGRDRPASGPRVVLIGPPNAGKSRLFNALLEPDQAIVSPAGRHDARLPERPLRLRGLPSS